MRYYIKVSHFIHYRLFNIRDPYHMINLPAIIIKAYCFSKVFYMQVFN
jgi:hypothetical protein